MKEKRKQARPNAADVPNGPCKTRLLNGEDLDRAGQRMLEDLARENPELRKLDLDRRGLTRSVVHLLEDLGRAAGGSLLLGCCTQGCCDDGLLEQVSQPAP